MNDDIYNELRKKLDVMGYNETLPILGIPLVAAIFADLVKTTEDLRDAKRKIVDLLEEKSCWELGVEPYKCDNSRLLMECNELNQQLLKQRDEHEWQICEYNRKLRDLQTDKLHIETHCQQLQQQLDVLVGKLQKSNKNYKTQGVGTQKLKKPFISTVRSGEALPPVPHNSHTSFRCANCNGGAVNQTTSSCINGLNPSSVVASIEFDRVQNSLRDSTDQLELYKRKIDRLNHEIQRLHNLLIGGRPPAALAKDCCKSTVKTPQVDLELLQHEIANQHDQIRKYQEGMHEGMQQALKLDRDKRKLQNDLDELKQAALQVENQANTEIALRDDELNALQVELKESRFNFENLLKNSESKLFKRIAGGNDLTDINEKHDLNEKLNKLTQRGAEIKLENEKLKRKLLKLHGKLSQCAGPKALSEKNDQNTLSLDEQNIRIKSERDFYQKEYLRLVNKTNVESKIEELQIQLKKKDEALQKLRSVICFRNGEVEGAVTPCEFHPATLRSGQNQISASCSARSDCVQAALMRVEQERDCARSEMERLRCERDTLREKILCINQLYAEELGGVRQRNKELQERVAQFERENQVLNSDLLPRETHIVLLKDDLTQLRQRNAEAQLDYTKLKTQYDQLKLLHERTERTLIEYQRKVTIAERQRQSADLRFTDVNSDRDSNREEVAKLRSDISALKQTYIELELDKDKLLNQLDVKTEQANQLEFELESCKEQRNSFEQEAKDLKAQLQLINSDVRIQSKSLKEALGECNTLRQQIAVLKHSSDQAINENGCLSNDLSDSQVEVRTLRKKLRDSDSEIERMKQQLRQYVQEVKRAEDLLTQKERERDEMLEHYRSLSHDAVMLEGNNQSLEVEANEYKRQIFDLETEVASLRKDLGCRQDVIAQLEDQIAALITSKTCLEHQLAESKDSLHLLNEDLTARKELCEKLDVERTKLNAELSELNQIKIKLEIENEILRNKMSKVSDGHNASYEAMADLLTNTRRELEKQITTDSKLNQELGRLREQLDNVMLELDKEKQQCDYQKTLAHEFRVQVGELRQNLTDDRFRQARSNEQTALSSSL